MDKKVSRNFVKRKKSCAKYSIAKGPGYSIRNKEKNLYREFEKKVNANLERIEKNFIDQKFIENNNKINLAEY